MRLLELKEKTISTVDVESESKSWNVIAGVVRQLRIRFTDGTTLVVGTNCDICEAEGCGHLTLKTERSVKREVIETVLDAVEM